MYWQNPVVHHGVTRVAIFKELMTKWLALAVLNLLVIGEGIISDLSVILR